MAEITVRKRGSKWYYSFELAPINGKRKRIERVGGTTKKQAQEAGIKAKAEYYNTGKHFDTTNISVSDYFDYWLENYVKINCRPNTIIRYKAIINNQIKQTFGNYYLKNLNSIVLQEYINSLYTNGYSNSMISNIKGVLSSSLDYAVNTCKLIQTNPMLSVKKPRFQKNNTITRTAISIDTFNTILNRFPEGSNFYIPLMLGFHAGLRISETFALTWDDIDFNAKTLTVNKQLLKQENKKWYFAPTKTLSSNRTITIGDTLLNALKKHKSHQEHNILKYKEYYIKTFKKNEFINNKKFELILQSDTNQYEMFKKIDMVCTKENGQLVTSESFKYCSRVVHYELGIKNFDFHTLRHTHATILIESGANIKDIQERLGHSNINITMDTYVHNTNNIRNKSIDLFKKAICQHL